MDNTRKTAMITGASRGIGKGIATVFAQAGYDLILCCRSRAQELKALSDQLTATYGIKTTIGCVEVSDWRAVKTFVTEAIHTYGYIDVLVNNAGVSYVGLLSDMKFTDWQKIIGTNLTGTYNFCHEVIPSMVSRKSGKIINISSVWGCSGASCEAAYSASKGGVNALTQALAKELAPSGIAVNAIACGTIDTEMNNCFSPEEKAALADEIPAGRFGTPEEVGRLALSIAESPVYLNGQIIKLDGAWI